MKLWLVLLSKKGGYEVHSAHESEETARQWMDCKVHDGADTALAEMDDSVTESIVRKGE